MQGLLDLLELPESELRTRLLAGEPADRLRAAWSLALRLSSAAVQPLRDTLTGDISEGFRQQLIVILAGLGERDAVREIANGDPAASVRAVAAAYAIRTAPRDDPETPLFARSKLGRDEAPEVRLAVLGELQAGRLRLHPADILPVLSDADDGLRRAALLSVVALAGEDPVARRGLATAISEDGPLLELISELARSEAVALLGALADGPAVVLASAVRAVRAGRVALSWDDVAFALDRSEPVVANEVLLAVPTCPPVAALDWVARSYLNSDDQFPEGRRSGWFFLKSLIAPDTVDLIDPHRRRVLAEELKTLRTATESALEVPEEEDGPDEYERDYYQAELVAIARVRTLLMGAG
jgi:hypothetical protein